MSGIPRSTPFALLVLVAALVICSGGPASAKPNPAKVCGPPFGGEIPAAQAAPGSLPAAELAAYGVFRRAATAADTPAGLPTGESLSESVGFHLASYDPTGIRLVAQLPSTAVYLVPGVGRALHLSAACLRALPKGAATYAAGVLQGVGTGPAFCLLAIASGQAQSATVTCSSFAAVAGGFAITLEGTARVLIGLVPDGVGAVSLTRTGTTTAVVGTVADNILAAPWPTAKLGLRDLRSRTRLRRFFDDAVPGSITWLAAPGGAVVKAFPRPRRLLDKLVNEGLVEGRYLMAVASTGSVTVCSTNTKHHTVCSTHHN